MTTSQSLFSRLRTLGWPAALLALLVLGLLARMLDYPLNRDEHMFLTAAVKLSQWRLYEDLGYNHLPNLPHLLNALLRMTGADHLLLAGRLVNFAFWLAALLALALIGRKLEAGRLATFAALFLLIGNVLLLGEPGMLAGNNFAPIPFALFAYLCLLRGLAASAPSPWQVGLAGVLVSVAIGLKANYIFLAPCFALAALLAPSSRPLAQRIAKGVVPLGLGGLLGAIPVFVYFAHDADAVIAHTLRYFTEPHAAYWAARPAEPQASTITQRIVLAEQIWLSGAGLLSLAAIATLALIRSGAANMSAHLRSKACWPLLLALSLAALAYVVAFLPKPSFPQYFVPPLPFLLLALLALAGQLDAAGRTIARPPLLAIAALAVLGSLSRLLPDIPRLARPGKLEVVQVHRQAKALARQAGLSPGDRVATLSPLLALEAGLDIYPEFAAGPFVYRVAPYISPWDRPYYRAVGAADLAAFLDRHPPAAILFETAEVPDPAFVRYAQARHYVSRPGISDPAKVPFSLLLRPERRQ